MANVHVIKASNGLLIPIVAADPSSPVNGTMWYNSSDSQFKFREDGVTKILSEADVAALGVSFDNSVETGDDRFDATNVQAAISEVMDAAESVSDDLSSVITLTGVSVGSEDLGSFSGDTIPDGQTIKQALQALETAVESAPDASDVTYTPDSSESWNGEEDPGNVDDALDQLAYRIKDAEDSLGYKADRDYVDGLAQGLEPKGSVRAAFTANVDLSHAEDDLEDGALVLEDGDLVVLTGQTDAKENGVYVVTDDEPGYTLSRAPNFDGNPDNEVKGGDWVYVQEGTKAGKSYVVIGTGARDVGADDIDFDVFSSMTPLSAGDAIEISDGAISVSVDDTTIEISSDALRLKSGGISDTHIAAEAGISATKIAGGQVSNEEFGHLDGVTSGIQAQLDGKLPGSVVSATLLPNETNTEVGDLSFAHASFMGQIVDYTIRVATTNRVRSGQLYISTNGTDTSITDTYTETADCGISWDLNISGATCQVRYTSDNDGNNRTLRAQVKRFAV